jgi:hypothetical protein
LAHLLEVSFDCGVEGETVFHCIVEGEAREGSVVASFDGGKPGGWDWITGGGVVEAIKCINAGEVVGIIGLRRHCGGGLGRRWIWRARGVWAWHACEDLV